MHSIYLQSANTSPGNNRETLATDIADGSMARELVRRIAKSFSDHGLVRNSGAYWFRDEDGVREIWCEPDRSDRAVLPASPNSARRHVGPALRSRRGNSVGKGFSRSAA